MYNDRAEFHAWIPDFEVGFYYLLICVICRVCILAQFIKFCDSPLFIASTMSKILMCHGRAQVYD